MSAQTDRNELLQIANNLENIRIGFDNAGGVMIWSDLYAHSYNDGKQPAEDVLVLIGGGSITDWDGNDEDLREAMSADPTGCDNFPGRYDVYTIAEIANLLKDGSIEIDENDVYIHDGRLNSRLSGYSESKFFRTLKAAN